MRLTFEGAVFKNILSFGNAETKLNFTKGLNLITGNNGSGKSTALLDTLSFCLFGQPYRKIKIEELINRINTKNLLVSYTFLINNDRYVLTRGLKPKILTITKNGNPVKLLSTKGLTQEEIDKILGINYKTFKQIISLSINHNEPFLNLPLPKKRELMEQISSTDVFAGMSKIVKTEIKDLKVKIQILENTINITQNSIDGDEKRITELEETEKRFEDDKKTEISDVDIDIRKYKSKYLEIKDNGKLLSEQLKKKPLNNIKELENKQLKILADIAENKIRVQNAENSIKFLDNHDVCPTCNNNITDDYKTGQKSSLIAIKNNHEELTKLYTEALTRVNSDIDKAVRENYKYDVKKNNIAILKDKAIDVQARIKSLNDRKHIIENRKFEFDINKAKLDIENKKSQLLNDISICKRDKQELVWRNVVVDALSDTGIKSFVFEEMIPILNFNINEYLKLFELPVVIEFDKYMNETIKVLGNGIENVSYYCFSEGEKKRIDMSILLSFIAIKKSIATWNCNLLVIDELFDSSIDEVGLQKLIESMNNMITDVNNLGIYIISHRLKKEYFSQFESLMEINKKGNGFSNIKYLKE